MNHDADGLLFAGDYKAPASLIGEGFCVPKSLRTKHLLVPARLFVLFAYLLNSLFSVEVWIVFELLAQQL